jgi:hypothetical protein
MEPILNRRLLHFHLEVAIYHLQTALDVPAVETLLSSEDYGGLYAAADEICGVLHALDEQDTSAAS